MFTIQYMEIAQSKERHMTLHEHSDVIQNMW